MKKVIFLILLMSFSFSYSQVISINTDTIPIKQNKQYSFSFDKTYNFGTQVNDKAFKKLLFSDVNFLILGDDSPQKGISYEYAKDKSSLKLSAYLGKISQSFFTLDGDFKTDEGLYFINDGDRGGTQAKVTMNWFVLSDWVFNNKRFFPELINEKDELNEKRSAAYLLADYAKTNHVIDLYLKYRALAELLERSNYPYADTYQVKLNEVETKMAILDIDPDKISHEFDTKNYIDQKEYQIQINATFEDETEDKKPQNANLDFNSNQYDLIKIVSDLKKVESKIDSLDNKLVELELEVNEDVWTSKHLFYFGVSPYYERQSKEFFNSNIQNETLIYSFKNLKRDLYGVNLNYNWFRQSQGKFFARNYIRANLELGRGSNFSDLALSTIRETIPIGSGANNEVLSHVKDKKAYNGDLPFDYAFKFGISFDAYIWLVDDFGIFSTIGYTNLDFDNDILNKKTVPFRAGIILDIKKADKKDKIAVVQAFIDRSDITEAPNNNTEELRFGFKVGIPINVKSKL